MGRIFYLLHYPFLLQRLEMSFLFAIREIFTGDPRKWLDFFVIQKKSNTFATAYKKH